MLEERITEYMQEYGLTYKQVKFALTYDGNATRTARKVGYKQPHVQGSRLLKNVGIRKLIDRITDRETARPTVLDRSQLMALWSELATDPTAKVADRLKAMDSLAKSQGIFIDRSQVISNVRVESLDKLTDDELLCKLTDLLVTLDEHGVPVSLPAPTRTETYTRDPDINEQEQSD